MRRRWLGVLAVFAVGVALRVGPLYRSPLPFNPDGVIYAGLAARTLTTGAVPLEVVAVDSLAFTTWVATVAHVTGATPLTIAQPAIAVVGTVPALLAAVIAVRLAAHHGYPPRTQTVAGVVAGLLLAVEGLYLHRSMPVDEQTVGLLVVPLAVYAVARTRTDGRYWLLAVPTLAVLPVLHNLDTVVAALALLTLAALATTRDRRHRIAALLGTAAGFSAYAVTITVAIATWTPAVIVQQSRLTDVPGLLLAWVIAVTLGLLWLRSTRPRRQRVLVATVFGAGFLVLAVNAVRPVFPGLPATHPMLLAALLPLAVLPVLGVVALPWVGEAPVDGRVVLALVGAPLVLVGVSLTASLTAPYLNTVYRAQTFIHLPVVVLAALGVTALLTRPVLTGHPTRQTAVVAVVVLAAAASVPIAFAGLEVLPYKGTTTPAELAASGFSTRYLEGAWASDDHLSRISTYYRPDPRFRTHPPAAVGAVATWLTGGDPPACPTLAQRSWPTIGAQLYPRSPATISPTAYDAWTTHNHVVYTVASREPIVLVVPRTDAGPGCTA